MVRISALSLVYNLFSNGHSGVTRAWLDQGPGTTTDQKLRGVSITFLPGTAEKGQGHRTERTKILTSDLQQLMLAAKMTDNEIFVLAMRKADKRQLRHFADRGMSPAHGKTPS